jgi:hypothetical protein
MLAVGLLVAAPVTLLVRDDESGPSPRELSAVELPELGKLQVDRELGVEMRLPDGWVSEKRGSVIVMRSADRQARVAVSSPGPAADADELHQQVLSGIEKTYKQSKVTEEALNLRIGGLKGATSEVEATGAGNQALGILVASAEGKKRAYLVVVYTRLDDPGPSAVEAQALLNELRFVG